MNDARLALALAAPPTLALSVSAYRRLLGEGRTKQLVLQLGCSSMLGGIFCCCGGKSDAGSGPLYLTMDHQRYAPLPQHARSDSEHAPDAQRLCSLC